MRCCKISCCKIWHKRKSHWERARIIYWCVFLHGLGSITQSKIIPGVSSVMSRNSYETIRSVHFVDNMIIMEDDKKQDWLRKVRPWISNLQSNFLEITPIEYYAVDEIMVFSKGQSVMRQYMPNKLDK